jgi:hypothetical protein
MFNQQFNKNNPLIIIAPHLEYPTINGADISLDRLGKYFSEYVPYVDIIATSSIVRYQNSQQIETTLLKNNFRNKKWAAIRTILFKSNYLKEKFVTSSYNQALVQYFKVHSGEPTNILCSYIFSAHLLDTKIKENNFCMIWTHNDDYRWFKDFFSKTNNILIKLVAHFSLQWTKKFLEKNKKYFLLLHVDDSDIKGYNQQHKALNNLRVNIGTDLPQVKILNSRSDSQIVLSFIGSLSVQMNIDALKYFYENYYTILKNAFGVNLEIKVIGSNPTDFVIQICKKNNWALNANVSDSEMAELLSYTTFTILPFQYTNGAKLKMLFSLGNGIPFLATHTMGNQIENTPPFCLVADDAKAWVNHISSVATNSSSKKINIRSQIIDYAQQFSWRESVKKLITSLEDRS